MDQSEAGTAMRRKVLGADHVARATAETTDMDRAFQSWITDAIWGDIWTREGLDIRTRAMVTIAILGALGHEELELHLRASVNTGVTREEIAEILLHVAAYAGAPAANKSFSLAKKTFEEDPQ